MDFEELVKKRFAAKEFNKEKVSDENLDRLFEIIRMSASSFGLQPFKVKVIKEQEIKDKLQTYSWNQAQIGTCSHLLVFCANMDIDLHIDLYEDLMREKNIPENSIKNYTNVMKDFISNLDSEEKLFWAQKQTYLAAANAINGAKELGFDSCPMEGFQVDDYVDVLDLDKELVPTIVVPIGYTNLETPEKLRFSKNELFF